MKSFLCNEEATSFFLGTHNFLSSLYKLLMMSIIGMFHDQKSIKFFAYVMNIVSAFFANCCFCWNKPNRKVPTSFRVSAGFDSCIVKDSRSRGKETVCLFHQVAVLKNYRVVLAIEVVLACGYYENFCKAHVKPFLTKCQTGDWNVLPFQEKKFRKKYYNWSWRIF